MAPDSNTGTAAPPEAYIGQCCNVSIAEIGNGARFGVSNEQLHVAQWGKSKRFRRRRSRLEVVVQSEQFGTHPAAMPNWVHNHINAIINGQAPSQGGFITSG